MRTEYERILEEIDRATAPSKMSQEQAKDWLESLVTDIESRIDGLKDDMANH